MDKPIYYYAFEILYWCGIREGKLLALTPSGFNSVRKTLRIDESYQRLKGRDVITCPKTKKSNRVVNVPDFVCEEISDYLNMLYGIKSSDRIFFRSCPKARSTSTSNAEQSKQDGDLIGLIHLINITLGHKWR